MITIMSFAILGFLSGIYLTVFGLLFIMVLVLAIYGGAIALISGAAVSDVAFALLVAAVALQLGYFVCVVLRSVMRRLHIGIAAARNAPLGVRKVRAGSKDEPSLKSWTGWFIRRPSGPPW
jgi:hypothetical protein